MMLGYFKTQEEISKAEYDKYFVSFHLQKIPPINDKYDLMVANGLYDYIIDCVAKTNFSKQYIRQIKNEANRFFKTINSYEYKVSKLYTTNKNTEIKINLLY